MYRESTMKILNLFLLTNFQFSGASFTWGHDNAPTLEDINLKIPQGKIYFLVKGITEGW